MATTAISKKDNALFEFLAGGKLLITIILVGTGMLFFVLWAKRQILRAFLINKKGPPDQAYLDVPKDLRREIEDALNRITAIQLEPQLLDDQSHTGAIYSSFVEAKDDSTYRLRRKVFDLINCLDDLLSRVDVCLARKPHQSVREHMNMLQRHPYAPFKDDLALCGCIVDMYEHARYGIKPFLERDFAKFLESLNELCARVHEKLTVPGSLVISSERHHSNPLLRDCSERSNLSDLQSAVPSIVSKCAD